MMVQNELAPCAHHAAHAAHAKKALVVDWLDGHVGQSYGASATRHHMTIRASVSEFLAVARAETRQLWRSTRVHIFLLLLVSVVLFAFSVGSYLHGAYSAEYPLVGLLGPRFFMSQFGGYMLMLGLAGAVLIASGAATGFDHLADTVASRPVSNLVLHGGRVFALVLTVWLSLVVALVAAQGIGRVGLLGQVALIDPVSISSFLFVDALPALTLWCALVVLLHAAVRSRSLAVFATLGLLAIFVLLWRTVALPAWAFSAIVPAGSLRYPVSDMVPWFIDVWTLLQRGATLVCAAGALLLAAGLCPRRDGRNSSMLLFGVLLVAVGCTGVALLAVREAKRNDLREKWATVHERASRVESVGFDIERLAGSVSIDPGAEVGIDLALHLRAHRQIQTLVFSFNPAMRVAKLRPSSEGGASGESVAFRHEEGLLVVDVAKPLAAGETLVLELGASGVPDGDFAYLDGAIDPRRVSTANGVRLLGTEALLFDDAYVALMPAAQWLPVAGANHGRNDGSKHLRDFFDLDLAVDVPATWHVAGASMMPSSEAPHRRRFRYRPATPVDEVGLLASAFERRHLRAGSVEIEILLHPRHMRNVELFASAADVVADYAKEILAHLDRQGLPFPYRKLSVVEVPAHLRSYGGGQRMAPALRLPGIVGLRETAFPTAHFDAFVDHIDSAIEDPRSAANAKAGHLITYARQAGLLRGVANSFLNTVAGASGADAPMLDLLCLALADHLLPRPNAARIESAHLFAQDGSAGLLVGLLPSLTDGVPAMLRVLLSRLEPTADRPAIWNRLTNVSSEANEVAGADFAGGTLALRVGKTAQAIVDMHGPRKSAALLSELRSRYAGRTFTVADFTATAAGLDMPIVPLLEPWLSGTALPLFVTSSAAVARLPDDGSGARYQTRLHVYNEADVPGVVALSTDRYGTDLAQPALVPGQTSIELDWVSPAPPANLWLHSYLSANRHPISIPVAETKTQTTLDAPAVHFGTRPSEWKPAPEQGLVVDDLDPGFFVETDGEDHRWWFRLSDRGTPELDQGLPVYGRDRPTLRTNTWHREVVPSAWGRHRRTIALADAGDGGTQAVATARLPKGGRWALAFYVPLAPPPDFPDGSAPPAHLRLLDSYDMVLRAGEDETPVEFDGRRAAFGWNALGTFEMPAGDVQLVISNRTPGQIVLFDAIRWRPNSP